MTQQGKLPRKRAEAIAALFSSPTIATAAHTCGVSERTLLRWLKDPEFVSEYRAAQSGLFEAAVNKLRSGAAEFISVLRTVALDPKTPPAARASASRAGLDAWLRALSLADIEARLTALEQAAIQLRTSRR
jgi:hypothetical protein